MKIIAYKRTSDSPWVACPRTTGAALSRFALLGTWEFLEIKNLDGSIRVISKPTKRLQPPAHRRGAA